MATSVTLCAVKVNLRHQGYHLLPQKYNYVCVCVFFFYHAMTVFACCVWFPQHTAIDFLNNSNRLVFVMMHKCVFNQVDQESLYAIQFRVTSGLWLRITDLSENIYAIFFFFFFFATAKWFLKIFALTDLQYLHFHATYRHQLCSEVRSIGVGKRRHKNLRQGVYKRGSKRCSWAE